MSIEKPTLRKLLQLLYADPRLQRSLLLDEIRNEERKGSGRSSSGGDFFGPFWADVKVHAAGGVDILESTAARVTSNKRRTRLYPALAEAFLSMWADRMRWRNEPFILESEGVRAEVKIRDVDLTVRIENTVVVKIWDGTSRIVYPYFSESPPLSEEAARLGFWILSSALPRFTLGGMRIVDFLRRAYFRATELPLVGDEAQVLERRYRALTHQWEELKRER
jgi:hypothetical protein